MSSEKCNILIQTNGNKYKAAEKLGMSRTTLWRKIKQYNIESMKKMFEPQYHPITYTKNPTLYSV